jgi:hypothetical protein
MHGNDFFVKRVTQNRHRNARGLAKTAARSASSASVIVAAWPRIEHGGGCRANAGIEREPVPVGDATPQSLNSALGDAEG